MTGKRYYITTHDAWQQHAHRFAQSHYLSLDSSFVALDKLAPPSNGVIPSPAAPEASPHAEPGLIGADGGEGSAFSSAPPVPSGKILVLVEADEGAHLALEDDSAFEALPHPFMQTPISPAAHAAISAHLATESLAPGATTFDAAEAAARLHPLLRPRVF